MNNRSRTFDGPAVPNDDQRRRVIAHEIQRVMVNHQRSALFASLIDDISMVNFFTDRRAQFPSNAGKYEIASLAFEYCRFDPENTVPAGTTVENAPTAGAEAAAPGDDIESESSKTTSTLSSNFPNAPTGDLVDTTPGNFSVSASDGPHADDYGASVPVIALGETNSSTRQTVVEQVRSGVAGLGLTTNNNPPTISTAAAPPALAGETLDGGDSSTSLGRTIDIYADGNSMRTTPMFSCFHLDS